MEKFVTRSEAETRAAAKKIAQSLVPGSVIALLGDLGAGKTAFTKGIAEFFEIEGDGVQLRRDLLRLEYARKSARGI